MVPLLTLVGSMQPDCAAMEGAPHDPQADSNRVGACACVILGRTALVAVRFDSGATNYFYCRMLAGTSDSTGELYHGCHTMIKVNFGRKCPAHARVGHFGRLTPRAAVGCCRLHDGARVCSAVATSRTWMLGGTWHDSSRCNFASSPTSSQAGSRRAHRGPSETQACRPLLVQRGPSGTASFGRPVVPRHPRAVASLEASRGCPGSSTGAGGLRCELGLRVVVVVDQLRRLRLAG